MGCTSSSAKVNGLTLRVHRWRDEGASPTGLTLVLLHGFADAGSTWDLVAEPLARAGHDVVAPDLRGFGESDRIGAGGYYYFPDYIADVAALIEAVAPARLGIVGHSMGGAVAAYYTGTFPARVERLALLEGIGPMTQEAPLAVTRMEAWLRDLGRLDRAPRPLASLDEALERLEANHPRVPRDVLATRALKLTRRAPDGSLEWAFDPLHRTVSPTLFSAASFGAFLDRIACPTLVVSGGRLGWRPPDHAERAARIARAEHAELPDAGHMMHWTAPGALAEKLLAFFGGGGDAALERSTAASRRAPA